MIRLLLSVSCDRVSCFKHLPYKTTGKMISVLLNKARRMSLETHLLEHVGKMPLEWWKLVNVSFFGFDERSCREYSGAKL